MKYKRNCPKCDRELTYTDRSNFFRAIKNNTNCAHCKIMPKEAKILISNKLKGIKKPNYKRRKNLPKNFERVCSGCNNKMYYVKEWSYLQAIKNDSKCNKCRMNERIHKTGNSFILNQDQINKMAATKAGYDSFDEYQNNISDFKKYKNKVMSITYKQPLSKLKNYDKKGRMGEKYAYNIDHIISIHKGFMNSIPAETIGNINNLKMIPWLDNIKKHKN